MKDLNKVISERYNRVSGVYDFMDTMIKHQWRKELLKHVSGEVLEAGVGTGANLPFYPEQVKVAGIDISEGMLKQARKKVASNHLQDKVTLRKMDIQDLEFPDNSFDYVISTCVFCSVPDPVKGLEELKRVCKPNGRIFMLEHMRSENVVLGPIMDVINPFVVRLWGANINRRTIENIKAAGLSIEKNEKLFGSVMRKLTLTVI
ncbi:class I SAM-dependent methyltransferase [Pseudalkalibacillus caeni]|uniref:Class I SAM-dependent methyltransferase n=1 Tax=Exobacillus caeni TaxID=2574798 RepID=A0A5R9FE96_9BACL|nr:class I SAM-dependent methyltransferase [Pseudalkalibacillus caeni]TLS38894.1 class I SAM-dependent methyltransferase [Pseudalkalibacillus caeni]